MKDTQPSQSKHPPRRALLFVLLVACGCGRPSRHVPAAAAPREMPGRARLAAADHPTAATRGRQIDAAGEPIPTYDRRELQTDPRGIPLPDAVRVAAQSQLTAPSELVDPATRRGARGEERGAKGEGRGAKGVHVGWAEFCEAHAATSTLDIECSTFNISNPPDQPHAPKTARVIARLTPQSGPAAEESPADRALVDYRSLAPGKVIGRLSVQPQTPQRATPPATAAETSPAQRAADRPRLAERTPPPTVRQQRGGGTPGPSVSAAPSNGAAPSAQAAPAVAAAAIQRTGSSPLAPRPSSLVPTPPETVSVRLRLTTGQRPSVVHEDTRPAASVAQTGGDAQPASPAVAATRPDADARPRGPLAERAGGLRLKPAGAALATGPRPAGDGAQAARPVVRIAAATPALASDTPAPPAAAPVALEAARPVPPRHVELRRPKTVLVSRQIQERLEYAFGLAERGALYSARKEFQETLKLCALALDAETGTRRYSDALREAFTALAEAEDFAPRNTPLRGPNDLARQVDTHRTPVLKDRVTPELSPLTALQTYFAYAQAQLVAAGGHQPVASAALLGLAKVHTLLAGEQTLGGPLAMALYQAALEIDPTNYEAANELGVLLAGYGQLREAELVLRHSESVSPQPEAWYNLAQVYRMLGDPRAAAPLASRQYQRALAARRRGEIPARPTLRWVDLETFAGHTLATVSADPQKRQTARPGGADPPVARAGWFTPGPLGNLGAILRGEPRGQPARAAQSKGR